MRLHHILPFVALVFATSCFLATGQLMVAFDLMSPVRITGSNALVAMQVDLNEIQTYREHKDHLDDLSDVALLGSITNESSGDAVDVEVWLTREKTQLQEVTAVRAQGIPLWGPVHVGARETLRVSWDDSAKLVYTNGRETLVQEAKGDGIFTLYFIDRTSIYNFTATGTTLVLVLSAEL